MSAKLPARPPEPPAQTRWQRWGPRLWRGSIALGTLLITLWFLPAFTRQWDDRQRARELKAGLAVEIATATAAMLGPTLDQQGTGQPVAARSRAWLVHRLIIGAKLRAYFDEIYLAQWNVYSDLTLKFVRVAEEIAKIRTKATIDQGVSKSQRDRIKGMLEEVPMSAGDREFITFLLNTGEPFSLPAVVTRLSETVLKREEVVTRRLLAAHPSGFSTSRTDLLRDVVPFWDLEEQDLPTP